MARTPPLSLETKDWLGDTKLSLCSPATRGVWMDLLCRMHDASQSGELQGTADELAQLARCSPAALLDAARELKEKGAADVRFDGQRFYIRNHRMWRKSQARKANAERQYAHRNAQSNRIVASNDATEAVFELFWAVYPAGRKRSKGKARVAFYKAVQKAQAETIIEAAKEYAASQVANSRFVKMPESWLNAECWADDRQAWLDLDLKEAPRPKEYREVSPSEFKHFIDEDEFLTKPHADKPDGQGRVRWFGQLRNMSKVETYVTAAN